MEANTPKENEQQFIEFIVDADVYRTTINKKFITRKPYKPHNPKIISSFMPGTIRKVFVDPGEEVGPNTVLCILEAMKMKNKIFSQIKGTVKAINVKPGQMVPKNFILIELE